MREIKLNAKQGEEINLTNGANCSLVVKVDDGVIIPDFVDALSYAIATHPREILVIAQNALHGMGGDARTVIAKIRDDAFASVEVPESTNGQATTTVNGDKP